MAQIPSDKQTAKLLNDSIREEEGKRRAQARQGKEFVNNGQGVIPEAVWQRIKRSNQ